MWSGSTISPAALEGLLTAGRTCRDELLQQRVGLRSSWCDALEGQTKHRRLGAVFAALIVLRKSWSEQKGRNYFISAGYEELCWASDSIRQELNWASPSNPAPRRGTVWMVREGYGCQGGPPISRWTAAWPWSTSSVQTLFSDWETVFNSWEY